MSTYNPIGAQIIDGIEPLEPDALGDGLSHISDALVAFKTFMQPGPRSDFFLLVAICLFSFKFGWYIGMNIYHLGSLAIWTTRRIVIPKTSVRMVANQGSRKRKLSEKAPSPRETSRSGQRVQISEEVERVYVADHNISGSDSHLDAISETSRSLAVVSHPVSGSKIGNSTPDASPRIPHESVNLNGTAAIVRTDNHIVPPPLLTLTVTTPKKSSSLENTVASLFADANVKPSLRRSKRKSAKKTIATAVVNPAVSPISTGKGTPMAMGLLTPPATPAMHLEPRAEGDVTPPHGVVNIAAGEEGSDENMPSSTATTPTGRKRNRKRNTAKKPQAV